MMVDETLLAQLGIEITATLGDELQARCPMHAFRTGKEDGSPSWSINAATGSHNCFSCHYKGSLARLVADVMGFTQPGAVGREGQTAEIPDYAAAEEWLTGNRTMSPDLLRRRQEQARGRVKRHRKDIQMGESRLALFTDPPEWALEGRGLTLEACQQHGVLWNPQRDSWITPIRDPYTSALWGWQEKAAEGRWFRNFPPGVQKRRTLFGLERYTGGQLVVVESPLDAVRLTSLGVPGAVSSFGAAVSDEQLDLMRGASPLVFALDNPAVDNAGKLASLDVLKRARAGKLTVWFFSYANVSAKDPGDMDPADIRAGLENMRHCVLGAAAVIPELEEVLRA